MCACARMCVYARASFRHPAPAAAAHGRVSAAQRPLRASQAEGCTAAGARRALRRPGTAALLPPRTRRLRWDCGSAPPAYAPRRPPGRKFSFGVSLSPIPVRVAAAREEGSPAAQPSMGRLAPSISLRSLLTELLERRGKSPGTGTQWPARPLRGRKERDAHLSAVHAGGLWPHARVRARGGSQRGWGRPERGPRSMPSGRAALRDCGAAGQSRRRRRCCCLQCRLAED